MRSLGKADPDYLWIRQVDLLNLWLRVYYRHRTVLGSLIEAETATPRT